MLAIIGGSGLSRLSDLEVTHRHSVTTPYGEAAAPLTFGRLDGAQIVFLARHGDSHAFAPHQVNYRANIWALKQQEVTAIVSVATVGGIRRSLHPGELLVPHQIIDYTWGRPSTFFEGPGAAVTHVDFTEPYSAGVRARLLAAAGACGVALGDGAVYAATQGPRLETAAEIDRLERDGADIVGMTGMPEAVLARELQLSYGAIAVVANHAAGRGGSRHAIRLEEIEAVVAGAMRQVHRIIRAMVTL